VTGSDRDGSESKDAFAVDAQVCDVWSCSAKYFRIMLDTLAVRNVLSCSDDGDAATMRPSPAERRRAYHLRSGVLVETTGASGVAAGSREAAMSRRRATDPRLLVRYRRQSRVNWRRQVAQWRTARVLAC
jgi:hypothetical protein